VIRWLAIRALLAVPVVVGVTTLTFVLIHISPGDPILLLAGDGGSAAYYDEMRAKYGLDRSIGEQFVRYVAAVLSGDLGYSFMFQRPVLPLLLDHAFASVLLGLAALVIAIVAGVGIGTGAALLHGRPFDLIAGGAAAVANAAPVFWTGQLLVLVAALWLGIAPVGGMTTARESLAGWSHAADVAQHLVLPALTLSIPLAALIARVARASILETTRETFVLATLARGLSRRRVLYRHVMPNATLPLVALVGQHAADLLAGAALTESLFAWPGLGYLVLHASLDRDYPLVIGAFLMISASVALLTAASDAAIAWIDPRVGLR
jgi:peptide/nickel transport system permease protein